MAAHWLRADLGDFDPAPAVREAAPEPPVDAQPLVTRIPALTPQRAALRSAAPDAARSRGIGFFGYLLERFRDQSGLAARALASGEVLGSLCPSLVAVFEVKKTATINKRATSMRQYVRWFDVGDFEPAAAFKEETVYQFLGYLNEVRSGSTCGKALLQALNFTGGLLEVPSFEAGRSPRVRGLVNRLAMTAAPRQQRAPLTVAMLGHLEHMAEHDVDSTRAILAGAAVFCCLARARVGDFRRCSEEPVLDEMVGGGAYIQTHFADHKTAKPGTRLALPVVAPMYGVSGNQWARAWLRRRAAAGLVGRSTLLPAPAVGGGWTDVALTTVEFGLVVRAFLREAFPMSALEHLGSHSLKVTTLAWMAKYGADRDDRRCLGYHVRPGDVVLETYSRDALAGPLRVLCRLLAQISAGTFVPDGTRSGYFPPPPASSTSPASTATDSSLASGDEGPNDDDDDQPAEEVAGIIVRNLRTAFVHLRDGDKLRCGKLLPVTMEVLDEIPEGSVLCQRCF